MFGNFQPTTTEAERVGRSETEIDKVPESA